MGTRWDALRFEDIPDSRTDGGRWPETLALREFTLPPDVSTIGVSQPLRGDAGFAPPWTGYPKGIAFCYPPWMETAAMPLMR